jgi:hypothetical protein
LGVHREDLGREMKELWQKKCGIRMKKKNNGE